MNFISSYVTVLHLGMNAFSWLVRCGLVDNMAAYAGPLQAMSLWFKGMGSTRGAMHVELVGRDHEQKPLRRVAHICSDNGTSNPLLINTSSETAGPEIPCTPAVVLVKKMAKEMHSKNKKIGAYPCISLFTIEEIMDSLKDYKIWIEYK